MKYKLLSVSKNKKLREINIGDYIQALASLQYYPQLDGFLDRDEDLKDYAGETCKIIMNGWYMHNPKNWPPSEKIVPLFVAFHLNVLAKNELTSERSIEYFKQHEPIGCRDKKTMEILKQYGINAYFSGCMTLTLGKKYHNEVKDNTTYIVDPPFEVRLNYRLVIKALRHLMKFPIDILRLIQMRKLRFLRGRNILKKCLKASLYHQEYSRVFSRDIVMNSIYICQESKYYIDSFHTEMERLKEAERLVKQYAKARLVITSRIHCALPCLGLETPVIYIERKQDSETSTCRLDGLRELFNVITLDKGKLEATFDTELPLSGKNIPSNKDLWHSLAYDLDCCCNSFIQ